jgi:excisionase family DNA binding protein
MAEKEFYSVKEVAEKLGVSKDTIRRLIRKGDFPANKIGGSIRIRWADAEEYLKRTRK